MCISPVELPDVGAVACRNCWQCRKDRVNDLVGRCIAEQNYSDQTIAVTLTYDDAKLAKEGREAHAVTLVYKDVQDFLKVLRKTYKVRYIVTGEYGSLRKRAHWHIILFIRGKTIPEAYSKLDREPHEIYIAQTKEDRIDWSGWQWGTSFFQRPDYGGFAYCLKYVLKDLYATVYRTHLAMSKKPPLGYEFIMDRADQMAASGLTPHDGSYEFDDQFVIRATGKRERRKFQLRDRMKEMFIDRWVHAWHRKYGGGIPVTEFLQDHFDKHVDVPNEEPTLTDRDIKIFRMTVRNAAPPLPDRHRPEFDPDQYDYETQHVVDYLVDFSGYGAIILKYDDCYLLKLKDIPWPATAKNPDAWLRHFPLVTGPEWERFKQNRVACYRSLAWQNRLRQALGQKPLPDGEI